MVKIKYINHIYGKQGKETDKTDKTKTHKGQIISDNGSITVLKSGRYSYYIDNDKILEVVTC